MVDYLKSIMAIGLLALPLSAISADSGGGTDAADDQATVDALLASAMRYEHAEGVPRDYGKAAELYCAAARAGSPAALYALGWMYANARGVARDDSVAEQLFKLAADKGHPHAQKMLRYVKSVSVSSLPSCLTPSPPPATVDEEQTTTNKAFPKGPIFKLVTKLAPRYDIDPQLALAIIAVESGFNAKAVSPKNAQGLMQLMPETAQRFRVRDAFDPEENIKGGLAYLQWLLAYFRGNVALVAAAYNAGERAVENYRGIPPYPETKDYVRKIMALYDKTIHPYQSHIVNASALTTEAPDVSR